MQALYILLERKRIDFRHFSDYKIYVFLHNKKYLIQYCQSESRRKKNDGNLGQIMREVGGVTADITHTNLYQNPE